MINAYQGNYSYDQSTVSNWNSTAIGVYYCGYILQDGRLFVLYVGKGVGQDGIRGRLLQHLGENKWLDVTSFGYAVCSTAKEAEDFERSEIDRLKPKYNEQGV